MKFYVGIDVGTSSVRAALVDAEGHVVKTCVRATRMWRPQLGFYIQSSDDIWRACCHVIKDVTSGVDPCNVRGLGFDATCSLVVVDRNGNPLGVSPQGEDEQNVVMWLDHRASLEAELINGTCHRVLQSYGGAISLEQQPPKLLWLKKNLGPDWWRRVGHMFDLPDFLTWMATGDTSRSLCSLVCKWAYQSGPNWSGWSEEFYERIGLGDLVGNNAEMIGNRVQIPGQAVAGGLSSKAARELSLREGTAVATSMIDAHCGAVGMLGCHSTVDSGAPVTSRLALVCGTSTCHLAVNEKCLFVPGVWGPLYSAMLPNLWLHEGGQSASGILVDHFLESHAGANLIRQRLPEGRRVQDELNEHLARLRCERGLPCVSHLTRDVHVWPDFHGNRSPLADPTLKGMVCGLSLSNAEEELAVLYLAVVQALAYGTRHIIQELTKAGHSFASILMCGGLSRNPLFVKMHADITGLPVVIPRETESVLLGGAMLAATASGDLPSLAVAMAAMGGDGDAFPPDLSVAGFHNRKYSVFLRMVEHQREYKSIMASNP